MAGGTGGHVFPALALARLLRERSHEVVWLGTERGLEARLIPAEGIPLERLSVAGLRGKGMLAWLAAPFRLTVALVQALRIMRRHQPLVVVGLGGTYNQGVHGRPTALAYGAYVADVFLPMVIPFTPGTNALWDPWQGSHNGKGLTEDAFDNATKVILNQDFVSGLTQTSKLLDYFPYLAPPRTADRLDRSQPAPARRTTSPVRPGGAAAAFA